MINSLKNDKWRPIVATSSHCFPSISSCLVATSYSRISIRISCKNPSAYQHTRHLLPHILQISIRISSKYPSAYSADIYPYIRISTSYSGISNHARPFFALQPVREPIFHTKKAWKFQEKKSKLILKWILQWELSSWLGRQWDLQTAGIRTRRRLKQSNFPIFLFVLSFSFFFYNFCLNVVLSCSENERKKNIARQILRILKYFFFQYITTHPQAVYI